jgi:hypothetical protein
MSRKYRRDLDEKERLEILVRDLKSENRQLRQRLSKLSKGYYKYLIEEMEQESEVEIKKKDKIEDKKICFDCQKGVLEKIVVLNRYWRQCNVCEKRTKTKIIDD